MRSVVKSAALVSAWFDMLPEYQRALARELQAGVLAAAPQLSSTVKWGNLVFQLRGANAIAIAPHRSYINLQFFDCPAVAEVHARLERSGARARNLRCRYGEPVDVALVHLLVRACLEARSEPAP